MVSIIVRRTFIVVFSMLLMNIAILSHAADSDTITTFRFGISNNLTRVVLDSKTAIHFQQLPSTNKHQLLLSLSSRNTSSQPNARDYKGSLIERLSFQPAGDHSLLTIDYTPTSSVSIQTLQPQGSYGHRLVIDITASAQQTPASKHDQSADTALFLRAQHALAEKKYPSAIAIYEQLMASDNTNTQQKATEYHAVALERFGKKQQAKAAYEQYLSLYLNSDGARRVQQRLNFLDSMANDRQQLKPARRRASKHETRFDTWGVLYEDYRWSQTTNDNNEATTGLSSAYSLLDINTRLKTQSLDLALRFNGGQESSLIDERDARNRLSYLYINAEHTDTGRSVRLGRQRQNQGGTLGRFDGLSLTSPINQAIELNVIAGYPVDRSTDTSIDSSRFFYGINANLEPFDNDLNINVFYIQQDYEGLTDRQAIGTEVRYFSPHYSLSGYLDYDIYFQELNALLLSSRFQMADKTHLSLSFNQRKSPYLTLRNALIGQEVDDLSILKDTVTSDEELEQLALDRTFDSTTINAYFDHGFSESLSFNSSFTASKLSDTKASGGVAAIEGNQVEYHLNNQLVIRNLFTDHDTGFAGFSLAKLSHSDVYSLYWRYRYNVTDNWRIFPRLAFQQRQSDNGTDQSKYAFLIRSEYRFLRDHRLDAEWGMDYYLSNDRFNNDSRYRIDYFSLGYSYLF